MTFDGAESRARLSRAKESVARGKMRDALADLESVRLAALRRGDVETLVEVVDLACHIRDSSRGLMGAARRGAAEQLASIARANIARLEHEARTAGPRAEPEPKSSSVVPDRAAALSDQLGSVNARLSQLRTQGDGRILTLSEQLTDTRERVAALADSKDLASFDAAETYYEDAVKRFDVVRSGYQHGFNSLRTELLEINRGFKELRGLAEEERRVALEAERAAAAAAREAEAARARARVAVETVPPPVVRPERPVAKPVPAPSPPAPRPARKPRPRPLRRRRRVLQRRIATRLQEVSWGELFGARTLAWAGGIVTILGIVLLFVVAVDRGWISPEARIGIGALASIAFFGTGLYLHQRFGPYYAALAAVGVGIAGAYGTLTASAVMYEFLPAPAALIVAGGIAAVGVAISIAWSTQMIAGLSLIGAMAMPAIIEQDVSTLGGAFIAVVAAATLFVAVRQRWRALLVIGGVVSGAQIAYVLSQVDPGPEWRLVALTGVFWLLYVLTGIAYQLRYGGRRLNFLATSFVLAGVVLGATAAARLFEGETYGVNEEGIALLFVALVQAALGAALHRLTDQRDLGTLLWGTGAAIGAVAVAEIFVGEWLTLIWAAQAAVLAWASVSLAERRLQLASALFLALAGGYTLAVSATPETLFVASASPAAGVPAVIFASLAAAVFAFDCRPLPGPDYQGPAAYQAIASWLDERQWLWRHVARWLAAVGGLYALSLAILGLAQWVGSGDVERRFQLGHAGVSALWAIMGLLLLYEGLARGSRALRITGFLWFGATLAKIFFFDLANLSSVARALSFLAVGSVLLVGAFFYQRYSSHDDRGRRGPPLSGGRPSTTSNA